MPGGVSAEKLGWGGAPSSRSAPQHGCFQGKWVLVEIPSHDLVRMTRCHSSPGNLLPGPHLHVRHGKGRRVQTSQRATCASLPHGWLGAELLRRWRRAPSHRSHGSQTQAGASVGQLLQPAGFQTLPSSRDYIAWQKKAGKMLLPHNFPLVGPFCRVPVQKEISEIKAVSGRVRPALSKSREVPAERALGTSASSETAVMSQQGDDCNSYFCPVSGEVRLGFFCLVLLPLSHF